MLGSGHVEQMYSDLGSDWRKALRKKGGVDDDMVVGVGVRRYEGGAARWWWWWWSGATGRIWIRDPESSRVDRLYRCNGAAGALMCTERRFTAQMAMGGKDSPSWNFTCRQATAVSGPAGAFAHQEVDQAG